MIPAAVPRKKHPRPNHFTLLELLVVMAIVSTLVSMLAPAFKAARDSAKRTQCSSNMHQLGIAFRLYQEDHGGMYPLSWVNNSDNWQSFLCDPVLRGGYLPTNWVTWNSSTTAKRIQAKFLCPTIVQTYNISGNHDQWGYCYNTTRVDISHLAANWPWNLAVYQNANLDALYPRQGSYSVLTDGNMASWNSDNDWNATTSFNPVDCAVAPVHGEYVNVLYMDAHVVAVKLGTAAEKTAFNQAWYGGIPSTLSNPYTTY